MAKQGCDEYHAFSRRGFIQKGVEVGILSALGLSMADYFAAAEASGTKVGSGKAESVVLLWLGGGASHLDSWDLKPDAPAEIRGEFKPIKTNVSGIEISEHLPLMAQQMDKVALIRSMTTGENAHERGTHYLMTGFEPLPGFAVPSYGSVAASLLPQRGALPPYISVPGEIMYGGAGFLGAALDPFSPGGDPNSGGFRVRDLDPVGGMTMEHLERRKTLRQNVDAAFTKFEKGSDRARTVNSFYQRAYNLISSSEARAAFDLKKEPANIREMYGYTQAGQSLLLARRLVESGVRFVTVSTGGWDTHGNLFNAFKGGLMPTLDKSLSGFLQDLSQRGMLEKTLVVMLSEFGRTPQVNRDGGRDHHGRCFSILMAGGGIKGGQVIGSSDARGFEPSERPIKPEDVSATIYNALGIDYTQSLSSPEGVRVTLSRGGRPIA